MKIKNLTRTIRPLLILLTALVILHTFVACGGLPASQIVEKETKSSVTYVDPPEHETLTYVETLAPYDNPMLPEYEDDVNNPTTTARYAASRESNKYHRPSCHYVDNILPENLVYYTSEDAAQRAGKSPCSVCRP